MDTMLELKHCVHVFSAVGFGGERTGGGRGALTCLDGQPVICSTGLALLLDGLAGRPSATAVIVRGNEESSMEIRLPGPA